MNNSVTEHTEQLFNIEECHKQDQLYKEYFCDSDVKLRQNKLTSNSNQPASSLSNNKNHTMFPSLV